MSAVVKLSSKLAGDFEVNGLDQTVTDLLERPKQLRVAVVWYDVKAIVEDVATSEHVPTIQVRRIEPLGDSGDVTDAIKKHVNDAIAKRTGRQPIPWDIVEVVEGHDPDQLAIDDDE
jgi:hypothetical protein